jgi:NAD(P)-dependent dehydrogenase (short-subunit alcohol dehydrogenase family)
MGLDGKVCIVTGGARGIGRAIAVAFVENGARVAVVSRTAAEIEYTSKMLKERGGEVIGVVTDVSSRASVENVVQKTISAFKTVDVLLLIALLFKSR